MVTADERRYVLANTIESRRIANEALEDLDFGVLDFPWMDERRDSTLVFRIAAEVAGSDALGSDAYSPRACHLEADLSRLRSILDANEVPRYRELCRDAGSVVAHVARNASPGTSEVDVARAIGAALFAADMRPAVLLVGGDDRIASYRHPAPTVAPWKRRLLIAVCAERHGMIAALTRIVTTRRDDELSRRTRCAADVFAALLTASVPGAIGADLFHAAAAAYAEAGFAGEERAHRQGGVIVVPRARMGGAPALDRYDWRPSGGRVESDDYRHKSRRDLPAARGRRRSAYGDARLALAGDQGTVAAIAGAGRGGAW